MAMIFISLKSISSTLHVLTSHVSTSHGFTSDVSTSHVSKTKPLSWGPWCWKGRDIFLLVFILMGSSPLRATMEANLDKAFQTLGMSHNTTMGGGYQDQTGGFYTGGSLFARSKVHQSDLYSLQLPDY